jgi:hypothetical protein
MPFYRCSTDARARAKRRSRARFAQGSEPGSTAHPKTSRRSICCQARQRTGRLKSNALRWGPRLPMATTLARRPADQDWDQLFRCRDIRRWSCADVANGAPDRTKRTSGMLRRASGRRQRHSTSTSVTSDDSSGSCAALGLDGVFRRERRGRLAVRVVSAGVRTECVFSGRAGADAPPTENDRPHARLETQSAVCSSTSSVRR